MLGRGGDGAIALGIYDISAGVDLSQGGFLGLGWIEERVDKADRDLHVLVGFLGALNEGVDQPVDLGDGHGGHHADGIALGHFAGQQPAQVSRLVDPVIEDRQVRVLRALVRAKDKSDLGELGGHLGDGVAIAEGIAEDDIWVVLGGLLAQDALHVTGIADVIGPGVVDLALPHGGLQGGVDHVVPRLFQRGGVRAEDLQLLGRRGRGRDNRRGHGLDDGLHGHLHQGGLHHGHGGEHHWRRGDDDRDRGGRGAGAQQQRQRAQQRGNTKQRAAFQHGILLLF